MKFQENECSTKNNSKYQSLSNKFQRGTTGTRKHLHSEAHQKKPESHLPGYRCGIDLLENPE